MIRLKKAITDRAWPTRDVAKRRSKKARLTSNAADGLSRR
jgi:hypothetical protein